MTQLANHPAYLQIEDRLDAVGQKFRVHRMVRGAILFGATAIASTWAATGAVYLFSRDGHGAGAAGYAIAAIWAAVLLSAAVLWILRPLVMRPKPIQMARMIESRLDGLHNGLTNALLLADRDDVAGNPWSPSILDEIAKRSLAQPLGGAVRWADLKTVVTRSLMIVVPMLVILAIFPSAFGRGWRQMLQPAAFVPAQGAAEIISVDPGNVTRVAGQPLEITVVARGPADSSAKVIFDHALPEMALAAVPSTSAIASEDMHFAGRVDHVDETLKYRVEVAGTQSEWFAVTIVRQIKLTDLSLIITPPSYTHLPQRTLAVKPNAPNETPITVPQGSTIMLTAATDVPVSAALLQAGSANVAPLPMKRDGSADRFTGKLTILEATTASVLITDSSGNIAATLPASPIAISCTKDAAPRIDLKWPTADAVVTPDAELKLSAMLHDDYAVMSSRVLMAAGPDAPLTPVDTKTYAITKAGDSPAADQEVAMVLKVDPAVRKHGQSIRLQLEAVDNRDLTALNKELGPQTTQSSVVEIKFRDKEISAAEKKEVADKLRAILLAMLKKERDLNSQAVAMKDGDKKSAAGIQTGQTELRDTMNSTADTFTFDDSTQVVKRTLQVMSLNVAKEAVDLAGQLQTEPAAPARKKIGLDLQSRQRRIISTLESLLAMLNNAPEPATQPADKRAGDMPNKAAVEKLNEALKKYMEEQRKILDQTASLAKRPVDDWTDKDKKLADELAMSQEKLDAFMKDAISDFSKNAEQDMSNASILKDAMAIYSEVTMAKDALKKKAEEIAVPLEESGLEGAKELSSNLEKWLMAEPDRQKWTQEDLASKSDTPMPELPKELEDMVGELMEEQEDLFDEMEDANANITDSIDKGVGWDAADGPIADMSAKGVTGNQLPNNNEMGGRSGEGRSGKSQGEFVGDNAIGKGGRNTPTRLDPTPFQQGQINDTSKDPVGGATGGGKMSGQGGQGLEGPVPTGPQQEMKRLAEKQAELRNKAERLDLKYQLGKYDNFKLLQATVLMRKVENDLNANRYSNALHRRDLLMDSLDTSQLLLGGQVHVREDTTPTVAQKTQRDINDAMKGDLPPAWSEALKQYYEKLGQQ